ncbi:TPA-induced transmembrane protein homolog isoform X2 [Xenopus laevis]|uniref:TPA-induced transmembrane protein homolog isoform X2 n=1 Tax=Xenopus laevis TaxID=8355 RepID=A0A8J0UDC3_XENLA|nr:TPA-induced transmembrane protein homolog isoform X2 [Xenopus laevis]
MSRNTSEHIPMGPLNGNEPEVIQPFLGTSTEQKKTECIGEIWRKLKPLIILIGIFLSLCLVVIISLVVYTNNYVDEDEYQDVALNMEKSMYTFTGSLTIKDNCVLEPLRINETTLQQRIEKVYSVSPALHPYFVSAEVKDLLIGENTSANLRLNFSMPSANQDERKYKMSKEFVGGILRQDIYDEENSQCQNSSVFLDPFQVTFAH